MSRKSSVKQIQDAFEINSNKDFNPKVFGNQNSFYNKEKRSEKEQKDVLSNRKDGNSYKKVENTPSNLKATDSDEFSQKNHKMKRKYGTVKHRVNEINRQSLTDIFTDQSSCKSEYSNRSSTSSKFDTNNEIQIENNSTRNSKIDIEKFERMFSETQDIDNKSNSASRSSTLKNKDISRNSSKIKPKVPAKTRPTSYQSSDGTQPNYITTNKPLKPDTSIISNRFKNNESKNDDVTPRKIPSKKFLVVPPKPRYINKIKPHPDMPSKTKEDLHAKIKAFNELANNQKTIIEPKRESIPSKINNNFNAVPEKESSNESESDTENAYCEIVRKHKGFEQANYKFDDETPESDSDSDEELATEYDTIENLNVTKITVERRYKVPSHDQEDSTFNVKRETYYDHNLNPRIEHITRNIKKNDGAPEYIEVGSVNKSILIMQELLQTELTYFRGLIKVYEDYMMYFREVAVTCPQSIVKVFGNIEEIYKGQFEFYTALTECSYNIDAMAEVFLNNVNMFNAYEAYTINKHLASRYSTGECLKVIQARDRELGNDLNLESYLLTPVQRLFRYLMLLRLLQETLIKESRPSDKLDAAVNYLDQLIEGTNIHARVIQRVQDSPIDFSHKGKYLMSEEFFIRNDKKKYQAVVILFEDAIIFTHKIDSDTYQYKDCIDLVDIYVRSITEDLNSFQLQNFTKYRESPHNKYVFDLETADPKTKNEWIKKIETLLWNQFAAHKKS